MHVGIGAGGEPFQQGELEFLNGRICCETKGALGKMKMPFMILYR